MSRDTCRRRFGTRPAHAGGVTDPHTHAVAVPPYPPVAYAFDSVPHGAHLVDLKVPAGIDRRITIPTQAVLAQRVATLAGGIAAPALASGQAA